ncbi:hypothetical protein MMC30_009253 [Trapelia coarctata]|nr:hypothetical protein [Trapelia coarctata]
MAVSLEYFSLLRVVSICGSLLVLYFFVNKARVALFGPLHKIPGPFIARWTNIRLKLAVLSGKRMYYIDSLHQKYGRIVRVAPLEVSISDPAAFKEMHKIQGGLRKSDWYVKLTGESEPGMFSVTDPKVHSERRKLFANAFTSGFLKKVEPSIRSKAELAVARIKEEIQLQGTADILKWWTFLATDVIGELCFGDSFRMLEQGKKNDYIHELEYTTVFTGLLAELPFLKPLFAFLPIPIFRRIYSSRTRLEAYGSESIARYRRSLVANPDQATPTFFTKVLQSGTLSDRQVELEATNNIVAGTDTTASTLTYMTWAVLRNPEIRARVLKEVESLPEGFSSEDVARKCPYVGCVIEETLRLYNAAPGSLPRAVPKGGKEFLGFYMPEGVTVATQAYTDHRDGSVFWEPLK